MCRNELSLTSNGLLLFNGTDNNLLEKSSYLSLAEPFPLSLLLKILHFSLFC